MNENPFSITFGKEPLLSVSRETELMEIYNSFSNVNPVSYVYIITGVRGSGKTVAMTVVSDFYKKQNDWICIELNPENDMLEQLASKLYDAGKLKKLFLKSEFNFSFQGIGFSISGDESVVNVSSFLNRELTYLRKKNIKVLVTIDEANSNNNMKVFIHEYQLLLRENFQVFLLMTGLYQNISSLENQKSLTFLYRAPKIYLDELNIKAISNSYKKIFNIDEIESTKLAKFTNGYAYAYQLLGSLIYENSKKSLDDDIIDEFDELIYERAYNIIYGELTKREKEILIASLSDNSNIAIKESLGISSSQLTNYKKVLFLKGIIDKDKNKVILKLPRFDEYIKFILNDNY